MIQTAHLYYCISLHMHILKVNDSAIAFNFNLLINLSKILRESFATFKRNTLFF